MSGCISSIPFLTYVLVLVNSLHRFNCWWSETLSAVSQPWGYSYAFLCMMCPSPVTCLTSTYSPFDGHFKYHLLHEALRGCPWFTGSFAHCPELPLKLTKVIAFFFRPAVHVTAGHKCRGDIIFAFHAALRYHSSSLSKLHQSSTKIHVIRLHHPYLSLWKLSTTILSFFFTH